MTIKGETAHLIQWEYQSTQIYTDPFNDIELDVIVTSPDGQTYTVPTFWMGEQKWGVRFIPKITGIYRLQTFCTDTHNSSLHNLQGTLTVSQSAKPSYNYLRLSDNKSYIVDSYKKPFFWLSDTWWMALSSRLSYPKDFQYLTAYRKNQGFNTIMLVAGLFPDMDSFDKRGCNEAGFPWEEKYSRINPSYFDKADERIAHLVEAELTPVILGAWGYYLQHLGEKKMKQHWRYIIARWGTYPVVWCIAGEASMPYYLSKDRANHTKVLLNGWTKIGRYIKKIDPFQRLLTIHPTEVGQAQVTDKYLLDINLLQASHHGYGSVANSIKLIHQEKNKTPHIPLIMSEVNYEGILCDTHDAVQRLTFWSAILSGSKGFGYGANGIWQVNTKDYPFGASPHGGTWGDTPWQEALILKGASHIASAKKVLEAYPWWLLEPKPSYIYPIQDQLDPKSVRVAGIDSSLRIAYFYMPVYPWEESHFKFTHLDTSAKYEGFFLNPRDGKKISIPTINITSDGCWEVSAFPTFEDWVVILEAQTSRSIYAPSKFTALTHHYYTHKSKIKKWIKRKIHHA